MDDYWEVVISKMTPNDLDAVIEVQCDAYEPRFCEAYEVFANKLNLFAAGCLVCRIRGNVVGYLFSHPGLLNDPPALNVKIGQMPSLPDCYFVHDLAIKKMFHGKKIGEMLAHKAQELAAEFGFSQMTLVAVQGSTGFCAKQGFIAAPVSSVIEERLLTYCEDACYMSYH